MARRSWVSIALSPYGFSLVFLVRRSSTLALICFLESNWSWMILTSVSSMHVVDGRLDGAIISVVISWSCHASTSFLLSSGALSTPAEMLVPACLPISVRVPSFAPMAAYNAIFWWSASLSTSNLSVILGGMTTVSAWVFELAASASSLDVLKTVSVVMTLVILDLGKNTGFFCEQEDNTFSGGLMNSTGFPR